MAGTSRPAARTASRSLILAISSSNTLMFSLPSFQTLADSSSDADWLLCEVAHQVTPRMPRVVTSPTIGLARKPIVAARILVTPVVACSLTVAAAA